MSLMQGHTENFSGDTLPGSQLIINGELMRPKERRILRVDLTSDVCVRFNYPALHNPLDGQLKRIEITLEKNQKIRTSTQEGTVETLSFDYSVDSILLGRFLAIRNSYISLLNDLKSEYTTDLITVKETAGNNFSDLVTYLNFLMTDVLFESASKLDKGKKPTQSELEFRGTIDGTAREAQRNLKIFASEGEGLRFLQALLSSDNDQLVACGIDFIKSDRKLSVQEELLAASQNRDLSEPVRSLTFGMLSPFYRKVLPQPTRW